MSIILVKKAAIQRHSLLHLIATMPEPVSSYKMGGKPSRLLSLIAFTLVFCCIFSSAALYANNPVLIKSTSHLKKSLGLALSPESFFVRNCSPCRVQLTAIGERLAVNFKFAPLKNNNRQLTSMVLTNVPSRATKPAFQQELFNINSFPISNTEGIFLGVADINRDGYNDLYLITAIKHRIRFADYWLYRPDTPEFYYIGNYPLFKIDAHRGDLITRQQVGNDRHSYEENRYYFRAAKLTLIEQVKVLPAGTVGRYKKIKSKLLADELKQVSVEWLSF